VGLILAILVLALLFGAVGFAVHILWVVAVIVFVLWIVGFAVGRGANAGARGWYRW